VSRGFSQDGLGPRLGGRLAGAGLRSPSTRLNNAKRFKRLSNLRDDLRQL
jgi:hypothetical protein